MNMQADARVPTLRTIRVIVGVLVLGLATAVTVFAALHATGNAPTPAGGSGAGAGGAAVGGGPGGGGVPDVMLMALGAVALGSGVMAMMLPGQLVRQGGARFRAAGTDAERDAVVLNTLSITTVLRCALVEGVGLFGAVLFLLYGAWAVLIAPALALLAMASFYPTDAKARAFRERLERAGGHDPRTGQTLR